MFKILASILILLASCLTSSTLHAHQKQTQDEIKSEAALFLMRHLEYTLETWVKPDASWEKQALWLHCTRKRLNEFKNAAEHYNVDEVRSSYVETLRFLDQFEEFLMDDVLYDFIADVERPESRDFKTIVTSGIASGMTGVDLGYKVGAGLGTVACPGLGTIAGAKGGAVLGGVIGAGVPLVDGLIDYRSSISKNSSLDSKVIATRLRRVDQLHRSFDETWASIGNHARILAGKKKYGWGDRIGFDRSNNSIKTRFRGQPDNPFLAILRADSLLRSSPAKAAEVLKNGAAFVPPDFDANVDIFDRVTIEMLLASSRIYAEQAIEHENQQFAKESIDCRETALRFSQESGDEFPLQSKITYARALVANGDTEKAKRLFGSIQKLAKSNSEVLVELASIALDLGNERECLDLVRSSFQSKLRWEPALLKDRRFAKLSRTGRQSLTEICANPLVGTWQAANGVTLDFYPTGRVVQRSSSKRFEGTFQTEDFSYLELRLENEVLKFGFEVTNNSLRMVGNGKNFEYRRKPIGIVGKWKFSNDDSVEFEADGSWQRNRRGETSSGKYSLIFNEGGKAVACIRERDKFELFAKPVRYDFEIENNKLRIRPEWSTTFYDYKRVN